MKRVLHLNAGNETGGGMVHILSLLGTLDRSSFILGVMEDGEMIQRARTLGIQTVHFNGSRRISASLIRRIITYIKKENIQCIHTHGPRANVYGYLLKKLLPIHWITTIHSDPTFDFEGKGLTGHVWQKAHLQVIKRADRLIGISRAFTDRLITLANIDESKVVTAYNGIDFQQVSSCSFNRSHFEIDEDAFVWITVGRLEHVKGQHVAIEAFASYLETEPNSVLLIVGEGSMKDVLQQQADQLGIGASILFLGERKDASTLFELADVTLLPSLSESFPLVLLESARMKTPAIASDVGGVGELITDDTLGWKVRAGDARALTCAMHEATSRKQAGELEIIGEKFYSFASAEFSLENFAKNIYNVYTELLV